MACVSANVPLHEQRSNTQYIPYSLSHLISLWLPISKILSTCSVKERSVAKRKEEKKLNRIHNDFSFIQITRKRTAVIWTNYAFSEWDQVCSGMFILPCFIYRNFQLVKIKQYRLKSLNSESRSTGKEETMTSFKVIHIFSMEQQPIMDQGLPIIEASRSHSDTPHSAELLWTSDRPVVDTSTWRHLDRHLCHEAGYELQSQQVSGRRPTP